MNKEFPVASERARLVFGVHMPTLSALRKYVLTCPSLCIVQQHQSLNVTYFASCVLREYGELLISCGLLGEALNVFKDLELWDNLIYCYRYAFPRAI